MSAFLALVFGVVVAAILTLAVLVVIAKSFIVIGPAQVGLVTRRVSSRHNSTDDPVAFAGEAGYQSELLMPGVRFKLWPTFSVAKYPWVQVPAGDYDVVFETVRFCFRSPVQNDVYFRNIKTGQNNLELVVEQSLQFDGEDFLVPASLLGQPIVGQNVSPFLCRTEVGNLHRWDLGKSQQLRRRNPPVTGDNLVGLVYQNGVGETELLDSGGDLPDLFACMRTCIARIGL